MSYKKTILVDFDGVLHSYSSGWKGATVIPDDPVPGAIDWLHSMVQTFEVVILSTRARWPWGRWAIRRWLRKHAGNCYWGFGMTNGIELVKITNRKVPAVVLIDDRCLRFDGRFPRWIELETFQPWNRKQ